MRNFFLLALCLTVLSACGSISSSSLNPFNWGRSAENAEKDIKPLVPERKKVEIVDNRVLVGTLTGLEVANVQGGVMVTATARPDKPGAFNAELVQTDIDKGTLNLAFRVQYPNRAASGATTSLSVGKFIDNGTLSGVRTIRVISKQNTLSRQY